MIKFLRLILRPKVNRFYATQTIPKPQKVIHLSNIQLPRNAFKRKRRVGRGGQKRTAGRGRKGYKMRHSTSTNIKTYEGGQSSIIKKMPKFGIQKRKVLLEQRRHLRPLFLDTLQQWINVKRIDPSKPIKIEDLVKSRVCGKVKDGIVLLQRGGEFLTSKVDIQVTKASIPAIKAIERLGGTVTTVFTDKDRIHALLNPQKYAKVPEMVLPTSRRLVGIYSDPVKRGYLAQYAKDTEKEKVFQKILAETGLPFNFTK